MKSQERALTGVSKTVPKYMTSGHFSYTRFTASYSCLKSVGLCCPLVRRVNSEGTYWNKNWRNNFQIKNVKNHPQRKFEFRDIECLTCISLHLIIWFIKFSKFVDQSSFTRVWLEFDIFLNFLSWASRMLCKDKKLITRTLKLKLLNIRFPENCIVSSQ